MSPCATKTSRCSRTQETDSSNPISGEGLNLKETSLIRNTIPFTEGNVPYLATSGGNSAELVRAAWLSIPDCKHVHLIVDSNVKQIGLSIAQELQAVVHTSVDIVNFNERDKFLKTVESLVAESVKSGITRRSAIAAVGGGVVSNLGGMVAGLLFRGLPLLHFPTTLLNAFDAVLSQKQAVNISGTKNLLGLYVLPSAIAVDFSWFAQLPERQIRSGLVELYKNALAVSPWQIDELNSATAMLKVTPDIAFAQLLKLSIDAKAPFLTVDGKEHSSAIVFEYGHTVGHALEAASMGHMSHGEAVAWGMLAAAELGHKLCALPDSAVQQHEELLAPLLAHAPRIETLHVTRLKEVILNDNKRGLLPEARSDATINAPMVLLNNLGSPIHTGPLPLVNVPIDAVIDAVEALSTRRLAA